MQLIHDILGNFVRSSMICTIEDIMKTSCVDDIETI